MLEKLIGWMKIHLNEVYGDLNGPATQEQLAALEEKIDIELPEQFKTLYLLHNGQKNKIYTGFFYGLTFLSLDTIYKEWKSWADIVDEEDEEGMADLSCFSESYIEGKVQKIYANKKWLPFAYDHAGNSLAIDFDPDDKGKVGQIINAGRDEDVKYVLADSFSEFIEWYIKELESGNYSIEVEDEDDGTRSFNTKIPESSHFLGAITTLFK